MAAPRLSASNPREPVPAYRSRTSAAGMVAAMDEKTASRARPVIGRVPEPGGALRVLPFAMPAMILMAGVASRLEEPFHLVPQQDPDLLPDVGMPVKPRVTVHQGERLLPRRGQFLDIGQDVGDPQVRES